MSGKPTVWISQETSHDFSSAESYGDIKFITVNDFNNTRESLMNKALANEISHKLQKFDEINDWLIVTGSPYVAAQVFLQLGNNGIRTVQMLRWDNRDFIYRPIHLELPR
jgi:hypothetical protein